MAKAIANNKWRLRIREVGAATYIVVNGLESLTPATGSDIQEYKTLEGGGATFRVKTGFNFQIDFEGKVNTEDEGQQLLASKEFSNGTASEVEYEAQNTEDGTIYSGKGLVDISQGWGGSAEDLSSFNGAILADGLVNKNIGSTDLGTLLKAKTCVEVADFEIEESSAVDEATLLAALSPLIDTIAGTSCGSSTEVVSDMTDARAENILIGATAGTTGHVHHIKLTLNLEEVEVSAKVTIIED